MNIYKGRLLKKSKLVLSTQVTTWFSNITFHLRPIWLQTMIAIDSKSRLTSFPSFCAAIWSRCAVRLKSEQTPFPQIGRRFRPAALHRIRFRTCSFVPMSYFYSESVRVRDQWMIERLSEAMFGRQQLLPNSNMIEIFISHEKKGDSLWRQCGPKFTMH